METVLIVVHLLLSLALIGLVLIQHGKGADAGAAFGSGASATVFGSQGSGNFLSRSTAILAALFFVTSLALAYFAMNTARDTGLMDRVEEPVAPVEQPASDLPPVADQPAATSDVPVAPVPAE